MSLCLLPAGLPPVSTHDTFYIGQPGAMTKLSKPDSGFTNALSRAEVMHALSSGGTTTTRRKDVKRTYGLPYSAMTADTADAMLSYYSGARGAGPFALVDPSWRNAMSLDASTFGAPIGKNTAWSANPLDAAPYLDTAFAPALPGSAVLHWPTPVNTHVLGNLTQPVSGTFIPDWVKGVPYLPDLPMIVTYWVRTVAGTSTGAVAYAFGLSRTGWLTPFPAKTVALSPITTTWAQVVIGVPVNQWTQAQGPIIAPALVCGQAGSPDILISNAQVTYGFNDITPWVTGFGIPRVSISAGVPSTVTVNWRRDHAYTLSEA